MNKHLTSLWDFDAEQLNTFISRALVLKQERKKGLQHNSLAGKTIGLIFEKPSTRTRVSFEAAMYGMGGQVIYLSGRDTQLARNEPLKDMARVLSRYVDGLVVRTFGQEIVDELAQYSTVPVINALTDQHHPCQILSDIMTVIEHKGDIQNQKIAWIGDGNNMANSWVQAAGRLGFTLTMACPKGYEPNAEILAKAQAKSNKPIVLIEDPKEAVADADAVNTDVWASMGQESEQDERVEIFQPYQVNKSLMQYAKNDCVVLHCLPAHREEEISTDILESDRCIAFDQAENKMHMHKAILEILL